MVGKEIIIVGHEHLVYKIDKYDDKLVVIVCIGGFATRNDCGRYEISRRVFDLNYNKESNTLDADNLIYPEKTVDELNEEIRQKRAEQYKLRTDDLYMAWQKYLHTGDSRADEAKQQWLDGIAAINQEYPYIY